ncbi:MAG: PhzF family phenazine biosynthesis protein, partial [Pseudomonadota bacterium]
MARSFNYVECDVFTSTPSRGNALAVVLDAEPLTDEEMFAFARWTNLAETTFVTAPPDDEADYAVRIFTPGREMPFAGHPTLGTCKAWLHAGGQPKDPHRIRQLCGVGVVEIVRDGDDLAFAAPPTTERPMDESMRNRIVDTLSIPLDAIRATRELDNGPVWQAFELSSADDVLALDASRVRWPNFKAIGVFGRHAAGAECDYEVRMPLEDPITGSLSAAIAHWLQRQGRLNTPLTMAQGQSIDRDGRIGLRLAPDQTALVSGEVHIVVTG